MKHGIILLTCCPWLYQVELLSGGVNMPVTPLNVYEYVRKYAEHRMLVVAEQPLHVSCTLYTSELTFTIIRGTK